MMITRYLNAIPGIFPSPKKNWAPCLAKHLDVMQLLLKLLEGLGLRV